MAFSSEAKPIVPRPEIIKRLDPDPVPGHQQYFVAVIPNGKGEHAPQLVEAALPELLIGVDDDLRIRIRPEHMTQPD